MTEPVLYFATQGSGHGDEDRIAALLGSLDAEALPFDRGSKIGSAARLLGTLIRRRPRLVVMEGTGFAGGLAVILARLLAGVPYVVSSGDAVGPFIAIQHPVLAPIAGVYERLLCRFSAGFIGWTPYLAGRALTFGAPRAMTAAGWAPAVSVDDRARIRHELGIPDEAIVFGIVGSLKWTDAVGYCYGAELVEAVLRVDRDDVHVVIVGDGSGLDRLRERAGEEVEGRVHLVGRVPREAVPGYLSAMDVGSLPQSLDGVGSFRYTTKVSEYVASRLPIVTGRIPMAYDLDDGWIWRLAGEAPWDDRFVSELAVLMAGLSAGDVASRRGSIPDGLPLFDFEHQRRRVTEFVRDLLEEGPDDGR